MSAPLRLWGREFEPFATALAAQGRAFAGTAGSKGAGVDAELLEIADLEHRLLDGDLATAGDADVLLLNTDWIPRCLERELLAPLDDHLAADAPPGWPDAWSPSLLDLQRADGRTYGLPYHDGPMMVLYRRDLYEDPGLVARYADRHGSALVPPATWDDFVAQARFFTEPGGRWGTILAGAPDAHNDVYDYLTQLWGRGGDVLDAAGRPSLDYPAALEAAEWLWHLWHSEGIVDPAAVGWDSVASGVHFAAGEAAMMVNWCGFAALAADPALPAHGRLGCAPAPAVAGGTAVTMNSYWILAVPRGSTDPDRAWRFIRHVATPEMDRITAFEGATAVRRDTWADPDVQRLAPYYAVLEEAHHGSRSVWRDPRWPAVADVLNDAMAALIGRAEPADACIAAARRALQQLNERESTP